MKDAHIAGMAAYKARYDRCAADPDDYWLGEAKQRLTWFVEPEVACPAGGLSTLRFLLGLRAENSTQVTSASIVTSPPGETRQPSFGLLMKWGFMNISLMQS